MLQCDCHLRPLRSWMSNQPNTSLWNDVTCHLPSHLTGQSLTAMSIDDFLCQDKIYAAEEVIIKPDIKIRGSEVLKDHGLRVVWYVATREDVAGFKAELRNLTGILVTEEVVPYNKREYIFRDLEPDEVYQLCFKAVDSLGAEREAFESQCTTVGPVGGAMRVKNSLFGAFLPILITIVIVFWKFYL
ncbi:hypothetical protein TNCV_4971391 [Trichonephila clavipes]|nr:hypothetical protein TNCV_4971391 [Trichonephila clavipes]